MKKEDKIALKNLMTQVNDLSNSLAELRAYVQTLSRNEV